MDKNRLWVIGAVLMIGATVVLGWMLGISPKLSEARGHQTERDTTLAQNAVYEAQLVTLKKQFGRIDALKGNLADIRQAVPRAAEIPAFVRELNTVAASNQVVLTGFTPNDAQAFDPALLGVDAADAPSTATPAETVDPRLTPSNFVAIPISVTVDGPYDNVLAFVSGIQHGSRLVMVTAVSTSVPAETGAVTGTITAFVYALLDPGAEIDTSTR